MDIIQSLFLTIFSAIEKNAFKVNQQNPNNLNALNDLILHPSLFIPYLELEFKNALCFNLIYLIIFLFFFPQNLLECLNCDQLMTVWLLILCILNISMVLPKILMIWKLTILGLDEDRMNLSRGLWLFVRCNAFALNSQISKTIFGLHLFGLLRFCHINSENCQRNLLYLYGAISFSFVLRVFFSLIRFQGTFSQRNLEKEEGLSLKQLNGLKIEELEKGFVEKFHGQDFCSICLEAFKLKEKVRVIRCPGKHIYHVVCIDKWFVAKKTCPNCNFKIRNININCF